MSLFATIKRRAARRLLRGPVMRWWMRRKARQFEARYLRALAESPALAPRTPAPRLKPGAPLRRIFFAVDAQWELRELAPELKKICEVEVLNLRPILAAHGDAEPLALITARAMKQFIASNPALEPDAILFYARPELLSDEAFHLLRKRWSCPLLGLNLDDKIEYLDYRIFASGNDDYQRWARQFDLNLSNVRAVVDWYADRGVPVFYFPEGFHPKTKGPPQSAAEFRREIAFVGSRRPEREAFFQRLRRLGVPVEALGYGWPNSEQGKDPEAIYCSTMLNLGIGYAAPSETLTTLKTRDFECPGAGACYLTTFNWELALHFDLGREILCYRSEAELAELFSFYRRRPEECLKIAQAAWRRCMSEHTWEQRFRNMFLQTGFKS